jgi:Mce-associated membrane protein
VPTRAAPATPITSPVESSITSPVESPVDSSTVGQRFAGLSRLAWLPRRKPAAAGGATRRQWFAAAAALVASLVVLGVLLGLTWRDPQDQPKADRVAASTARASIEQMLSYNYKTIDAQAAQIETLLTGPFKAEFTAAMSKDIVPLAVKNQTVVQARVSDVGIMSSTPTTVRVLAFVNQARIGASSTTPTVDQNRVIATMSKVGDRWLISKVEAF